MEDRQLLDTIERYLNGSMLPEEKKYFQQMRKNTPEIDQMVVEHRLFLQQMDVYADQKNFMQTLSSVHADLLERGEISDNEETEEPKRGKVLQLWTKYKRTMAIAASIAGVTALLISLFITPASTKSDIQELSRELYKQNQQINALKTEIKKDQPAAKAVPRNFTMGGTGFLIDGRGYLVTNAHVLKGKGVVVNNNGTDLTATIAYIDKEKDLALLKIDDVAFKTFSSLPYSFKNGNFDLGADIYTLGYPRDVIVYNSGYISATSGKDGDTSNLQISLPANPGNSGGPVLNKNGEIVGILRSRETDAEGVVFAVKSKEIYDMLNDLKKEDTSYQSIKMPVTSNLKKLDREQQVKKVSDFVYQVKVYN